MARPADDTKLCELAGVREYGGGEPVELWRNDETGRLVIRAYNEGGYNCTDVDLLDLVDWLQAGPAQRVLDDGKRAIAIGGHFLRNREDT